MTSPTPHPEQGREDAIHTRGREMARLYDENRDLRARLAKVTVACAQRKEWMEKNGHESHFIRDIIAEAVGPEEADRIAMRAFSESEKESTP